MITVITFIVAFCSIVYELVLSQMLSAFLGNTILRYSVTIGLYLFAMGFGAMFAEGKWLKHSIKSFLIIELFLTLFGGFSIILMFVFEIVFTTGLLFGIFAHLLILIIGILTGFEIPLLIEIGKKFKNLQGHIVLGTDYLGAFLGSIVFSFFFYSRLGLVPTAFITAFLNGIAGVAMYIYSIKNRTKISKERNNKLIFVFQLFLIFILIVGIVYSQKINDYFIDKLVA